MTPLQLIGRLHPLVVHFPIACIVLAGAGETVRLFWNRPQLGAFVTWALGIGTLAAVLALPTGFVFAYEYHPQPSLRWMLQLHRWLGVATAVVAFTAWIAARTWIETLSPSKRWLRRGIVWLASLALIATAHFGALMVWGEDYFSQS